MEQAHVIYFGKVQGIGFRFTVHGFATDLNLTGWIKNLPDGSVEMITEGEKDTIGQLCKDIEEYFRGYIQDKKIQFSDKLEEFTKFEIMQ